jgi:uncharacterized protein with HEPN domain
MNAGRRYLDYLEDVFAAMLKSQEFVKDMSYEEFVADEKTVYAVIRALEVVGEATKQIPRAVRATYEEIPWRAMSGMRDKLIHYYFGVDLAVVWKTVTEEVPELLPSIQKVLEQEQA